MVLRERPVRHEAHSLSEYLYAYQQTADLRNVRLLLLDLTAASELRRRVSVKPLHRQTKHTFVEMHSHTFQAELKRNNFPAGMHASDSQRV